MRILVSLLLVSTAHAFMVRPPAAVATPMNEVDSMCLENVAEYCVQSEDCSLEDKEAISNTLLTQMDSLSNRLVEFGGLAPLVSVDVSPYAQPMKEMDITCVMNAAEYCLNGGNCDSDMMEAFATRFSHEGAILARRVAHMRHLRRKLDVSEPHIQSLMDSIASNLSMDETLVPTLQH